MTPLVANIEDLPKSLTSFQEGDIVIAKVTPCFENGNIAIAPHLPQNYGLGSSELFIFRPFGVQTKYLFYYFQATPFKDACASTMTGIGGLKRISADFLRICSVPLPPKKIQIEIARYLDETCKQAELLIQEKEKQVKVLAQYKQPLIYEYVTGKKAVPM